ncbi:fructosamine-3-kinase [Halogeometricum pallidum JCM 14848]|uniref:Fructosamine-3-kinase n=1 Tax=Halogeometricum pallidum JCM 14848 TaxID=1227487 RepID=M0CTN8_HALPD|nr:fructosamine kinase family protein [Halogeometricum pallidum]ELZ26566.1 fructosamine-3-kinase [Halogeometricum pallidum JCM 14848]
MTDATDETPPEPEAIRARAESRFESPVSTLTELDGGEVGTVYRVDFADRDPVVAKVGDTPLSVEARMLRYLAAESSLPVPEVYDASDDLLFMAYVEGDGRVTRSVERDAADHLAALHGVTADRSGFPFDTLSGAFALPNPWTDSWVEFFREHRLLDCADACVAEGKLPTSDRERVGALASDLDSLLTEPDAPALVHGDVWRENVIVRDGEVRAFIDPATYYGHPEIELAYVALFGSFGDDFFDRYDERRGIEEGFFETRAAVYGVHPLIEHVRHFGDAYLPRLRRSLRELGY